MWVKDGLRVTLKNLAEACGYHAKPSILGSG